MSEQLRCAWGMVETCSDNVQEVKPFKEEETFLVPMCDSCLKHHNDIVYLHESGVDVEAVVMLTLSAVNELAEAYRYVNSKEAEQKRNLWLKIKEGNATYKDIKKLQKLHKFIGE